MRANQAKRGVLHEKCGECGQRHGFGVDCQTYRQWTKRVMSGSGVLMLPYFSKKQVANDPSVEWVKRHDAIVVISRIVNQNEAMKKLLEDPLISGDGDECRWCSGAWVHPRSGRCSQCAGRSKYQHEKRCPWVQVFEASEPKT